MPISDKDFNDFVNSVSVGDDPFQPPDRLRNRLSEWVSALDELYVMVESFLSDHIEKGTIRLSYDEVDLNENYIGPYKLKRMLIQIGSRYVRLLPVGTVIIGGKGRVDVIGQVGKSRLVLIEESVNKPQDLIRVTVRQEGSNAPAATESTGTANYQWKIATNPPALRFIELEKGNFLELLLEVSNA